MNAPENCCTCAHRFQCRSWYGGTGCQYRGEIAKKVTEG